MLCHRRAYACSLLKTCCVAQACLLPTYSSVVSTCSVVGLQQVLAYYGYVNLNWKTVTTAFLWGLDADNDG
jgi:hypothetical protein